MTRDALERLAANPHYKMTQRQLDQLRALRMKDVQHDTSVPKHSKGFEKHDTKPKKASDERD
jgi:hypothetical protein